LRAAPLWCREAASVAGLALMAAALVMLRADSVFPAWNAIAPCLGAGLILWAGCGAGPVPSVNAALGWAPLQFFGAISYALYLVHWPVAAFFHYGLLRDPAGLEPWVMLAFSVALAYGLWAWVEQPFLKPRPRWRGGTRGALLGGFGAMLAAGAALVWAQGVPARFPDYSDPDISAQNQWGGPHCFNENLSKPVNWDRAACTRTHGKKHRILLWGDSFAAHYAPGLMQNSAALDSDVLQVTFAGCPPILAFSSLSRLGCTPSNAAVPALVARERADMVVLSARWTDVPRRTLLRLHETVQALQKQGVRVVVIGQSPLFLADVRRLDYNSGQSKAAEGRLAISFDPAINRLLAKEAGSAQFIDPLPKLCAGNACPYRQGRSWLYADYGHFSAEGSRLAVVGYLLQAIR